MTTYGSLYEATRNLPLKQVTAMVRTEVRETIKKFNEKGYGVGSSVTMRHHSSLDVDLQLSDELYDLYQEYGQDLYQEVQSGGYVRLSAEFMRTFKDGKYAKLAELYELKKVVEDIRTKYNYDDSDPMTDYLAVRYFGDTKFTKGKRGCQVITATTNNPSASADGD